MTDGEIFHQAPPPRASPAPPRWPGASNHLRATRSAVILRSRALARRLEGWPRAPALVAILRGSQRLAPQDDGSAALLEAIASPYMVPSRRPVRLTAKEKSHGTEAP